MREGTFDHLAVAMPSIREALPLFMDVFGAEFICGADDDRLGIRTIQLRLPPGVKIELMEPISEDSYLHRYLEKHGPGFHHMTTFFPDIEQVIPELEERGFEVIDSDLSDPAWRETYVRPRRGFGTLLQIVDTTADWHAPRPGMTAEDVLAGRLVWAGSDIRWRDDFEGGEA
jgi:methylmalonyl-CoA/ethylmalonyl-CoA epimerase